jgi:hypothetical protein
MMPNASLIECFIPKTAEVAKTQDPLSEFRCAQFACYPVSLGQIVRCGLEIVPASSETEDKFEDPTGSNGKLTAL